MEEGRVLTKTKLFGSFKRFLYVTEQKGNSLFLYVFLKKRKQADGLKLVIGLLTFFEHDAYNLIVLERVAVVTSQRRTKKAHAFIHDQIFSQKKKKRYLCVYHCNYCTSMLEPTVKQV